MGCNLVVLMMLWLLINSEDNLGISFMGCV